MKQPSPKKKQPIKILIKKASRTSICLSVIFITIKTRLVEKTTRLVFSVFIYLSSLLGKLQSAFSYMLR